MGIRMCEVEGCSNVARVNKIINHVQIRGKRCEKHHRVKHPRTAKFWRWAGHFIKCNICNWEGPCDGHRIDQGGRYTKDNVISICPNCHRLVHSGMYRFEGRNVVKNEGVFKETKTNNGYKVKWF